MKTFNCWVCLMAALAFSALGNVTAASAFLAALFVITSRKD